MLRTFFQSLWIVCCLNIMYLSGKGVFFDYELEPKDLAAIFGLASILGIAFLSGVFHSRTSDGSAMPFSRLTKSRKRRKFLVGDSWESHGLYYTVLTDKETGEPIFVSSPEYFYGSNSIEVGGHDE